MPRQIVLLTNPATGCRSGASYRSRTVRLGPLPLTVEAVPGSLEAIAP